MQKPLILIADPNNDRAEAVETALAEVRSRRPDAVVVDFPFPLNGTCLSVALRDHPDTADIPVVAFSSWDFPRTRDKAREYGCHAFVPHTRGPDGLARAVADLLEREPVV